MIVNKDQVKIGIKKFVENELAHKATGMMKFMIYFIMPSMDQKIVDLTNQLQDNVMFKDMFDENKNVDIDKVHERALFAIDKVGNKLFIEQYGISLDRNDIEKLYTYIKQS